MNNNFNWGKSTQDHIKYSTKDLFQKRIYEKKFQVEENDIVVDIGATVGEFTYSILHKKPKHCYVVEPMAIFFDTLKKNLEGHPVSFTNAAISSSKNLEIYWDNEVQTCRALTFKEFIEQNRLFKIDFLKVDCEGGEYDIFSEENINFLSKIPKIAVEFHTGFSGFTEKFLKIKNTLKVFKKIDFEDIEGRNLNDEVFSCETWPDGHPFMKNFGYFNINFYADNR